MLEGFYDQITLYMSVYVCAYVCVLFSIVMCLLCLVIYLSLHIIGFVNHLLSGDLCKCSQELVMSAHTSTHMHMNLHI